MQVRETQNGFLIVLARGEQVIETLTSFCKERGITGGVLRGIGAVKNATLGYYSLAKKEYFFKTFPEDMEVASMQGNIALVDGEPFLHAHVVLSRMDDTLSCVGAHLKEAEVAVTLEVFLAPHERPTERFLDEDIGLKLMRLS